ncbi:MAG: hypothetical protein JWQ20_2932 [Conexibacter sp.]|jgi:hypothetical protein|nr:hypothetical protein [Conexibacter sp.]
MRASGEAVRGDRSAGGPEGQRPPGRDLYRQLARERARSAGLENGITALEHRISVLSAELKHLRARTA